MMVAVRTQAFNAHVSAQCPGEAEMLKAVASGNCFHRNHQLKECFPSFTFVVEGKLRLLLPPEDYLYALHWVHTSSASSASSLLLLTFSAGVCKLVTWLIIILL